LGNKIIESNVLTIHSSNPLDPESDQMFKGPTFAAEVSLWVVMMHCFQENQCRDHKLKILSGCCVNVDVRKTFLT
jgi:hypothetical protein